MNKRGILLIWILLIVLPGVMALERGDYWNKIDKGYGRYELEVYSEFINFNNGSDYETINTTIVSSNYSNFIYELEIPFYSAYFRNNSNTAKPVRFEKEGYFFIYDISEGVIQWREQPGFPARTDTLGGGAPSNSQDSFAAINNNILTYPAAFYNTNVTYELSNTMLKETFILTGLPSLKDYLYLEYTGRVYFNRSLKICANNQCYIPSGTEDNFETSGKIEFQDEYNKTIFYLTEPIIIDSNGTTITGIYYVHGSDAQMGFDLRINKTFLETAVFPVYIDPSVKINTSVGGGDSYVGDAGDANKNFGTSALLKTGSSARSYLQFNISLIPENQQIDSAEMCLYLTTSKNQLINVSQVYEDFDELTLTWNNQPCGTNFDNSSACNLTPESWVRMNATYDSTWRCFNVKNGMQKAYDDQMSFKAILYTSDADINTYNSKEYFNSSLWPYLNITYSLSDIFYPEFSNYTETPANNSAYSSGQFYQFNVTLNESNLDEIGIEFNGVNYTSLTNVSDIYIFNRTNLAAGTYSYYWWAKDIVGNYNTSLIKYYTVSKAIPSVNLSLNSNADNVTLTYLQNLNASASSTGGTISLYRENININSENFLNKVLGAGYYVYRANVTGNQNYTDSQGVILYANVTKASPSSGMQMVITPSSNVNYGTQTSATASETNTGDQDLAYNLFRNNISIANPNTETLNSAIYIYEYNTTGGQNYTSGSVNATLTVNKLSNAVILLLNGATNNLTLNYLQQLNASARSDSGIISLYRNSVNVDSENSANKILAAGYYEYFANSSGSLNYLENSTGIKFYVDINKAIPSGTLTNNESWTVTYGTSVTMGYSESNSGDADVAYKVYRNGEDKGSGESVVLGAGEYNYSISTNGGQNYSAASNLDEKTLIVNKKTSIATLTFDKTSPQSYGSEINASCTTNNPEGTLKLYRNGIDVTAGENGKNIILPVGVNNYTCNVTESQNYTASSYSGNFSIEKAVGEIKLYLNGIESDLEIVYPQQYNLTAATLYGNVAIYFNGTDVTANNGLNVTPDMLEEYYNVTAVSSGDENHSSAAITRWLNVIFDSIPPSLSLVSPDGTYGYNESISLEFIVSDSNLESCWYNINEGENVTLPGCQNNTVNVSGNGNYNMSLFANDSMGNEAVASGEFSVNIGAPTIVLKSPVNAYLNYSSIVFRYTPLDIDLESCELWGDFDGTFKYNQTYFSPLNGSDNFFNLTLPDGNYTWNVKCNDSQGHTAFNGNRVFYIDSINPRLILSQPSGKKTSRTISASWSIADSSPVTCWYNVYKGASPEIANITVNCALSTTAFSVSSDGSFVFNFYINDSAGNKNQLTLNFTVDTSIVQPPSGGGGGGGGGGAPVILTPRIYSLEISSLSNIVIDPGQNKKMVLKARNNGTFFLNECKLLGKGENAGWISSSGTRGLSAGEEYEFTFNMKVPDKLDAGSYLIELFLGCIESNASASFNADIIEKKLKVSLVKVEKDNNGAVRVTYSLEELSNVNQQVQIDISLINKTNEKVAEFKDSKTITAASKEEFEAVLSSEEELSGTFNLLINALSDTSSAFVQEEVVLGESKVSGLAILDASQKNLIFTIILIAVFLAFAGIVLFRILKFRGFKRRTQIKSVLLERDEGKLKAQGIPAGSIEIIKKPF